MGAARKCVIWTVSLLMMGVLPSKVLGKESGMMFGQSKEQVGLQCDIILKLQYPPLRDDALTKSLEKTALALAAGMEKPVPGLKVVVLNDPAPNIFSIPNQLFITTGLLDLLDNRDELACLMSKEIAYLANETHLGFYESEKTKKKAMKWTMEALSMMIIVAGAAIPPAMALASGASSSLGVATSLSKDVVTQTLIRTGIQTVSQIVSGMGTQAVTSHIGALKVETVIDNRVSALKRQSLLAQQKGKREAYLQLSTQISQLHSQRQSYIQELRVKNPRYAALWYPQPVMPGEVPMRSNEYLLRYKVTDSVVLAWLLKDGALVQSATTPISRKLLRQNIQQYLEPFQEVRAYAQLEKYDARLSKELYDLLLQPVAAQIPAGSRLIIVPDDVLEVLPFESLLVDASGPVAMAQGKFGPFPKGVKYVADHWNVSYYYSATSLRLVRQSRPQAPSSQSLFMMADPMTDQAGRAAAPGQVQRNLMSMAQKGDWKGLQNQFAPLPYARELASKLRDVFPDGQFHVGVAANKDNLSGIENHKYLVFATHGILARELPYLEEPALVLYPESGATEEIRPRGFLTMSEVMKLNLSCDNASLTACSTGLGRRTSGEGVMSLGWAFQYAGAKSVMVSLWKVEEKSTILLTEKFFQNLKAGKDKLSALAEARAELRRNGYEHPFYWAPFILIGEVR